MNGQTYTFGSEPTEPQTRFVRALQHRLHLPDRLLNDYCVQRFETPFSKLNRQQVSSLLDEMKEWQEIPADLQRLRGQMDLFPVREEQT